MNLLRWYLPLETCNSLDEICSRWRPLLDEHYLTAGSEDPRYEDAILSFLANSQLPGALKLGALLSCVSSADLDMRLAVGLLDEESESASEEWPTIVEDAMTMNGPSLVLSTSDPWLSAFVAGRLAGLRDTFGHDGTSMQLWRSVFWHKYLELACRWADKSGVQLALQHGAQAQYDSWAALAATVEGAHAHALRTPYYTEGRTNADYRDILQLLVATGTNLPALSDIVLPAAAAVDNVDMLEELLSQGVDLSTAGAPALQAAASNFAANAVDWLLAMGVNVHAEGDAALIGAIASLNESLVETLLMAGADVNAGDVDPLCTAATAQPAELFNGKDDFITERADMIVLLLRHGANAKHPAFNATLRTVPDGRDVVELLTEHENLGEDTQVAFRALLAAMPATERG
jgi:hypothetical protein